MSNNSFEGGVTFYSLDEQSLKVIAQDMANVFDAVNSSWSKVTKEEVEKVLVLSVRVYYFLVHFESLVTLGRSIMPKYWVETIASNLFVPRFVRDICREMCRPMTSNEHRYLPDIAVGDPSKGIDAFGKVSDFLGRWNLACRRMDYEMVNVELEAPSEVPLSFYDPANNQLFAVRPLPDWRIEATGYLKHLQHVPPPPVLVNNVVVDFPGPQPYHSALNGRYAGSFACFTYDLKTLFRLNFISSAYRFPTEDSHSRTPKRTSERVKKRLGKEAPKG